MARHRRNAYYPQEVHRYLRDQILNGQIGPNERLVETRIAKEIGTSRTPVREALHNLELEGLIDSIPRVGYRVKPISGEEAAEIYEIRCLIEVLAIRWALEKGRDRLVRELKTNIDLAHERLSEGKVGAMVELDAQFHETIARLSGGRRLLELAQTLREACPAIQAARVVRPGQRRARAGRPPADTRGHRGGSGRGDKGGRGGPPRPVQGRRVPRYRAEAEGKEALTYRVYLYKMECRRRAHSRTVLSCGVNLPEIVKEASSS